MKHIIAICLLVVGCASSNKAVEFADAMRAAAGPSVRISCSDWGTATDDTTGARYDVALCHGPGVVLRCTASSAIVPRCDVLAGRAADRPQATASAPQQATTNPSVPVPPVPPPQVAGENHSPPPPPPPNPPILPPSHPPGR